LLKPVLTAIAEVKAQFVPVSRYQPPPDSDRNSDILIFDRFGPSAPPRVHSIWIEPPAARSPIRVKSAGAKQKVVRWNSESSLGIGLHAKDIEFSKALVFDTQPDDIAIASSDSGPLIVARKGPPETVVLGFHPTDSGMKYELSTPLLFANILRWMSPDSFRAVELTTGTVGTITAPLESEVDPRQVQVVTEDGRTLPFSISGRDLRFFSGSTGIVRVLTGGHESVYSLTLPEPGDVVWQPSGARNGVPRRLPFQPNSRDIWQWLAVLGALGLLVEWLLFGRNVRRPTRSRPASARGGAAWKKAS